MFLTDDAPYVAEIATLEPRLNSAFENSRLLLEVARETRRALGDFLLRCRKALGGFTPRLKTAACHWKLPGRHAARSETFCCVAAKRWAGSCSKWQSMC